MRAQEGVSTDRAFPNAIETQGLCRRFGSVLAVDRLSLTVPRATIFGFLGPNGAGKTTTIRMLAGLIAPSSGTAMVAGYPLAGDKTALRRSIGFLTESPGLYDKLTGLENLVFFGRLYGMSQAGALSQAERYLDLFALGEMRNRRTGGFSKGMRQKIALARALLHEPALLFLDEPTAGLDPVSARAVRDCILLLRSEGRTIFLNTHNLAEAEALCDCLAIMKQQVLRLGPPSELRSTFSRKKTIVRFRNSAESFLGCVEALPFVRGAAVSSGNLEVFSVNSEERNPELIRVLVQAGAEITAVENIYPSLEEVYLRLIENTETAKETLPQSS
jgi:ABC-2 type transport system ATP-binding protein